MKTKVILGCMFMVICTSILNAQALWSANGIDIYNANYGNVGINNTAPIYKLEVDIWNAGDGIRINQTDPTQAEVSLRINNAVANGTEWSLNSLNNNSSPSGPHFMLYNANISSSALFINGTNNKVGLGTNSPSDMLTVAGNVVPDADNSYTCGKSGQKWSAVWAQNGTIQTSDIRKKTDIKDLNYGIKDILKLRPVSYRWKEKDNGIRLGLIAQELKEVIGEVVYPGDDENKNLGVAYAELIPVLIKGMQEQQKQIEELKNKINGQQTESSERPTDVGNLQTVDKLYNLEQNVPNPLAHETTINYSLPKDVSNAYMAIYDLSGKQITTFELDLINKSHLTINSDELSAGIYIYSIIADGIILDSKRMVVAGK